jgi:2-polyprenyl-3-methyl-5-hydroxy-6-metoxy-1,4-benzoquinol methylase
MVLSPLLYRWVIRPDYFTEKYINKRIKSNFDFSDKRVLDFGCGVGTSCNLCEPNNYLGIELDGKRIEYAKATYPQYNFAIYDGKTLPPLDNPVDYILIVAVLHHLANEDIMNYLKQFKKILNNNGQLIIIEPCFKEDSYINNTFMNYFDDGEYIRLEENYLSIFKEMNFQINVLERYQKVLYNEIFFTAWI